MTEEEREDLPELIALYLVEREEGMKHPAVALAGLLG